MRTLTIILFIALTLLFPVFLWMAFLGSPAERTLGDTIRVLYLHVGSAWVAAVAFLITGVLALLHLIRGTRRWFDRAFLCAGLGMLFIVIATLTGAVWAKAAWGAYWSWDVRQTSVLFLLLSYAAYLMLASGARGTVRAERTASAYLLAVTFCMPFFIFIAPRLATTLHPDLTGGAPRSGLAMEPVMGMTMGLSVLCTSVLFALLLVLAWRTLPEES